MNPRIFSTPAYLGGLSRLMALMAHELETEDKGKNSEDGKRVGKTTGQGLLYTN
jgi:hypothetical protein